MSGLVVSPWKNQGKNTPKGIHSDGRSFFSQYKDLVSPVKKRDALFSKWMNQIQHQVLFLFSFLRFYSCRSSGREGVVFEKSAALLLREIDRSAQIFYHKVGSYGEFHLL